MHKAQRHTGVPHEEAAFTSSRRTRPHPLGKEEGEEDVGSEGGHLHVEFAQVPFLIFGVHLEVNQKTVEGRSLASPFIQPPCQSLPQKQKKHFFGGHTGITHLAYPLNPAQTALVQVNKWSTKR